MSDTRLYLSLIMRTALFLISGLLMIALFKLLGYENAMQEAEKWWPYQAILANSATYLVLKRFLKKENASYQSITNFKKKKFRKDMTKAILYLIIALPFAVVGLYGLSFLVLGSAQPPTTMMQAMPLWAAIIASLLFPISNAFVEIPTYMGYAFPRIEKKWGSALVAVILTGFFLSIQHGPLPIVLGGSYLIWRLFSFLPLAIVVAVIYSRTRNVAPLIIAHFILDFQMVMYVLLASMGVQIV